MSENKETTKAQKDFDILNKMKALPGGLVIIPLVEDIKILLLFLYFFVFAHFIISLLFLLRKGAPFVPSLVFSMYPQEHPLSL